MSLSSDPEMRHDFGKSPDVSDVDSESTNQHSLMTSVIATYTVTADNYSDLLRLILGWLSYTYYSPTEPMPVL